MINIGPLKLKCKRRSIHSFENAKSASAPCMALVNFSRNITGLPLVSMHEVYMTTISQGSFSVLVEHKRKINLSTFLFDLPSARAASVLGSQRTQEEENINRIDALSIEAFMTEIMN